MSPALAWGQQINCRTDCDGGLSSKALGSCPEGTAIFPEPAGGLSGWGRGGWDWSITDRTKAPAHHTQDNWEISWTGQHITIPKP